MAGNSIEHIHGDLGRLKSRSRVAITLIEIKTEIKDIGALRLACQELGLTLLQNTG
jgi:hypothetical protein